MNGALIRLARDERGNFAIIASVLAVPLVLAAGAALDLSTISQTQNALQQAMDSAVLAVARQGTDITDEEANKIAMTFVANNYHLKYTDLKVVRKGTSVKVQANTKAGLAFGGLLGYSDWPVQAASSADIAYASYEIALVLDTTGSMAGGKLQSMKDAVDGMIESMSAQIKDKNRLRFSLVPFATFVNVGPEYGPTFNAKGKMVKGTGAAWLDIKGKSDIPQLELKKGVSRFEVMYKMGQPWKGCVETRMADKKGAHDTADTTPNAKDVRSLFVPAFAIDEPDSGEFENSYIASDVDPLDKSLVGETKKLLKYGVATVTGALGTDTDTGSAITELLTIGSVALDELGAGEGPGRGCDMQPIAPLTNDYNSLRSKVKALNATGTTNIMEGVAWGMRVLSPGEPFAQGAKKDATGVEKIMVVLTDGANNIGPRSTKLGSSYSSFGYLVDGRLQVPGAAGSSSPTDLMNAKTLEACANAKKDGVTVYTIRLEEPDAKTGTMLKECASSPDHYFDAPSRTQLDEVFKTIRDRVVRLRLSA